MVLVLFHKLRLLDQPILVAEHGTGIIKLVLNVQQDGFSIQIEFVFLLMIIVLHTTQLEFVLLVLKVLLSIMAFVKSHKFKLQDQLILDVKLGIGITKDASNVQPDGSSITEFVDQLKTCAKILMPTLEHAQAVMKVIKFEMVNAYFAIVINLKILDAKLGIGKNKFVSNVLKIGFSKKEQVVSQSMINAEHQV